MSQFIQIVFFVKQHQTEHSTIRMQFKVLIVNIHPYIRDSALKCLRGGHGQTILVMELEYLLLEGEIGSGDQQNL